MIFKILHIHNDKKFFKKAASFKNNYFHNDYLFIGKVFNYSLSLNDSNVIFEECLDSIVNVCNLYHCVVVYNLDYKKSYIVNRINNDIIVFWRFYGIELYKYEMNNLTTELTKYYSRSSLIGSIFKKMVMRFTDIISFNKNKLKYANKNSEFKQSVKRANMFMGINEYEYDYFKKKYEYLPNFIRLPKMSNISSLIDIKDKNRYIILGNSGNSQNNHFDILKLIEEYEYNYYSIIIPLSYDNNKIYSKNLKKYVDKINNISVIEKYLDRENYKKIFYKSIAYVDNSLRQRAAGNINIAIEHGLAIYLNPQSIMYKCLKNDGIKVYSIDNYVRHYKEGSIEKHGLKYMKTNINNIIKIQNKYNIERFQKNIIKRMKEWRCEI